MSWLWCGLQVTCIFVHFHKMIGNHGCGSDEGVHFIPQHTITNCIKPYENNRSPNLWQCKYILKVIYLNNKGGQHIVNVNTWCKSRFSLSIMISIKDFVIMVRFSNGFPNHRTHHMSLCYCAHCQNIRNWIKWEKKMFVPTPISSHICVRFDGCGIFLQVSDEICIISPLAKVVKEFGL